MWDRDSGAEIIYIHLRDAGQMAAWPGAGDLMMVGEDGFGRR